MNVIYWTVVLLLGLPGPASAGELGTLPQGHEAMQPRCDQGNATPPPTWYRADVDLDGDHNPELLLARSDTPAGNAGRWFVVYRREDLGALAHVGEVFAHPLAMSRGVPETEPPDGLLAYIRSDASSGTLVRYTLTGHSVQRVAVRTLYPRTADRELYGRLFDSEQRIPISESDCEDGTLRWTP